MRRAQTSLFIIVGLVLLVTVGVLVYATTQATTAEEVPNTDFSTAFTQLDFCTQLLLEDSLEELIKERLVTGQQQPPHEYPILVERSIINLLSEDELEETLQQVVNDNFEEYCADTQALQDQGYEIQLEDLQVTLGDHEATIQLPATITHEEETQTRTINNQARTNARDAHALLQLYSEQEASVSEAFNVGALLLYTTLTGYQYEVIDMKYNTAFVNLHYQNNQITSFATVYDAVIYQ